MTDMVPSGGGEVEVYYKWSTAVHKWQIFKVVLSSKEIGGITYSSKYNSCKWRQGRKLLILSVLIIQITYSERILFKKDIAIFDTM